MAQHVAIGIQDTDGGNVGVGNSLLPARLAQQIFWRKRRRRTVVFLRENRRDFTAVSRHQRQTFETCCFPILVAVLTDVRQARLANYADGTGTGLAVYTVLCSRLGVE